MQKIHYLLTMIILSIAAVTAKAEGDNINTVSASNSEQLSESEEKTDNSGEYDYSITIEIADRLWNETLNPIHEPSQKPRQLSFAEFPFHEVHYIVTVTERDDNSVYAKLDIPLSWPTYYVWDQIIEELGSGSPIPEEELNQDMVEIDEIFLAKEDEKHGKRFISPQTVYFANISDYYDTGYVKSFPIVGKSILDYEPPKQVIDGEETYLTEQNLERLSEIMFVSKDTGADLYRISHKFYFENGKSLIFDYTGKLAVTRNAAPSSVEVRPEADTVSITALAEGINVVSASATHLSVYDINGVRLAEKILKDNEPTTIHLPKGIYLVKAGDTVKKIAI